MDQEVIIEMLNQSKLLDQKEERALIKNPKEPKLQQESETPEDNMDPEETLEETLEELLLAKEVTKPKLKESKLADQPKSKPNTQ